MINSENILYLGVLVIIVYLAMGYATIHPNREAAWVKLLSFAPSNAPDSFKLIYNWGKLVMFVGLGLQIFNIALYVGFVMSMIGIILFMNAIKSLKKDDDNE
jgi:hypothetical protein